MCNHSVLQVGQAVTVHVSNWSECDCGHVRDNWDFAAIYLGHRNIDGIVCGVFDFCEPKPLCPACGNKCDVYADHCHGDTAPELFTAVTAQIPEQEREG